MTHVHVHLFHGSDPRHYRKGDGIGCLYGYHHAESAEFELSYSRDAAESRPMRFLRRALKATAGFDFIHTWRNRDAILSCDAVWTHTEQEYLSAALLLLLKGKRKGQPLLLAQSIWLLDKWSGYGAWRRWLYRRLIARADILTTHSSVNAALVREYFGRDATQVFYGLNTQDFALNEPQTWTPHAPLRIGAIGNDRDRDWTTLATAFRNDERYEVRIATRRRVSASLRASNVQVAPAIGLNAARELYDWADVMVVPLRANTHASGLTVLLESVALGKPVIVTDVGGLRDYFGTGHVSYVPAHDHAALRRAVDELRANPSLALARAQAALRHFKARDYTTRAFALQHVRLTRDALERGKGASEAASTAQTVFASRELTR